MTGALTDVEASRTVGVAVVLTRLAGGCELAFNANRRRGRGGRYEMGARGIKQEWEGRDRQGSQCRSRRQIRLAPRRDRPGRPNKSIS